MQGELPQPADPNPPKAVSTDAVALVEGYRQMLITLFATAMVVMGAIVVSLVVQHYCFPNLPLPILLYVVASGALGALFSALARLYSLDQLPAALLRPEFHSLRNVYFAVYALIPAVIGMIAAAVLYLMVMAGWIGGQLLPHFVCGLGSDKCSSMDGLMNFGPADVQDYAKALVWGFFAGFSERLVPDTLASFAKKAVAE